MIPRPLTGCGDITVCLVRDASKNRFTNEDLSRLKGFAVTIGNQEGPVVGTILDAWLDNGSLFGQIRLRLTRACWKAVVSGLARPFSAVAVPADEASEARCSPRHMSP